MTSPNSPTTGPVRIRRVRCANPRCYQHNDAFRRRSRRSWGDAMTRVSGIGALAWLVALAFVLPLWLLTPATHSLARQEDELAPVEVGAGPIREQALGFTGRNVYS